MKKISMIITAFAVVIGLSAFVAPAANATPPSCSGVNTQQGNGTCSDIVPSQSASSASSSVSDSSVSVNGVDIHSKVTVAAFIQAKGATKAQMHGKKYRLKHATCLKTSWRVDRGYGWHTKCYPKGYTFVWGKDGYWHDPKCWNSVLGLPKGKKHFPKGYIQIKGKIKIVKKFAFKVTSKATASDHATAKAEAWANSYDTAGNQVCHSEASANGSASFSASATASATGSVLSKVRASARGKASQALKVKLAGKSLVDIHVDTIAKASGKATATASAKASCSVSTPPPPATCPPGTTWNDTNHNGKVDEGECEAPSTPPEIVTWTQLQSEDAIHQGGTSPNFRVTVGLPNGDAGTLTLNTKYGHFALTDDVRAPAVSSFSVKDGDTITLVYIAPNDTTSSDLTEEVKATLVDSTTGLKAQDSQTFTVHPKPVRP